MGKNCQFGGITNVIAALGWKWFVKNPEATVESNVLEFYANFPNVYDNKVKLRNVLVLFGPYDIKAHYGLMDIGQFEYETYLSDVNYIDVIEKFGMEGLSGKPKGFEVKYLSNMVCIKKYFVCSKLMPTTHHAFVDKEKDILLHAIISTMTIDVGIIIHN